VGVVERGWWCRGRWGGGVVEVGTIRGCFLV